MNQVKFPALVGDSPLAILAAIGTMRLIHEYTMRVVDNDSNQIFDLPITRKALQLIRDFGEPYAQLHWDPTDYCPILTSPLLEDAMIKHFLEDDLSPQIGDPEKKIFAIVKHLFKGVIKKIPDGSVIPNGPKNFPPAHGSPSRLQVPQGALQEFENKILDAQKSPPETRQPSNKEGCQKHSLSHDEKIAQKTLQSWLASLITDLSFSRKEGNKAAKEKRKRAWIDFLGDLPTSQDFDIHKGCVTSQFIALTGNQTINSMLKTSLKMVTENQKFLIDAFTGWRREVGFTGEYLDHRAAWSTADDAYGENQGMRGVPGATWLALMSYPLWTTTVTKRRNYAKGSRQDSKSPQSRPTKEDANKKPVRTSGWHSTFTKQKRHQEELRLPLWKEPLGPAAVKALVEHPALDGDLNDPQTKEEIRLLGIFHICRSCRYHPPGSQSAGILIPSDNYDSQTR